LGIDCQPPIAKFEDITVNVKYIHTDATTTIVNLIDSVNIGNTHSLFLMDNYQSFLLNVCPDVFTENDFTPPNCADYQGFTRADCQSNTPKGGYTCFIDNIGGKDYVSVEDLPSSGIGYQPELPPPVPEFTAIGVLIALLFVVVGMGFLVFKKK
jgi:hypothetical protein